MKALSGRFAALQIQGDREYQEDDYGLLDNIDQSQSNSEHTVMVLADGMGGHAGGDEASHTVTSTFLEAFQKAEGSIAARLEKGMQTANDAISDAVRENASLDGMGCTLVGVSVNEAGLQWISVGDSPMWLFRDGRLIRLNEDHSMVPVLMDLVEAGRLSKKDAATDRRRSALRSAVMGGEISLVDLCEEPIAIQQSDILLIASDGIETLDESEIISILGEAAEDELETTAARLLAAVEKANKPYQDNTSIILFRPQQSWGPEEPAGGFNLEKYKNTGFGKTTKPPAKGGFSGLISKLLGRD
jgi:PPM family protein phosphatase